MQHAEPPAPDPRTATEVAAVEPLGDLAETRHPDAPQSGTGQPEVIDRAAALLCSGQLVAFPTETVYGLGANALDDTAVAAVFRAKGRPSTDPLIVHVPDASAAAALACDWPTAAQELAQAFWPGPLSLVVRPRAGLPAAVSAGLDSVALRVPAHPVALALLRVAQVPVAAPSANRFGRISPTSAEHVLEELDGRVALILDAGPTVLGVESTVLDLTGATPRLLRPGGVTLEDLRDVIGQVEHRERISEPMHQPASAPGQLLGHYAPGTPTVLVEGGARVAGSLVERLRERGVQAAVVELGDDPRRAAQHLYAKLRAADRLGAELLVVHTVDPSGLGRAVNDRVFRSAHGRLAPDDSSATVERLVRRVRSV